MENKNEKSMTLEEMISEMLKDAKVVKVPLPAKAEEKTETQEQDKPMPARISMRSSSFPRWNASRRPVRIRWSWWRSGWITATWFHLALVPATA